MTLQGHLETMKRPATDIIAVGIGLPGPVEHSTGKPTSPPIMPGWADLMSLLQLASNGDERETDMEAAS